MPCVLFYFSIALGGFGANLVVPTLLALRYAEGDSAVVYFFQAVLILFVSGALFFSFLGGAQRLRRGDAFVLVALVWGVLIVLGAVPIMLIADVPWYDGVFESASGLTTTGASVFGSVETLPRSLIFWRSQLQWLGGLLILLTFVLVLAPTNAGGLPDGFEHDTRSVRRATLFTQARMGVITREITAIYGFVTCMAFISLLMSRVPGFDALCLALSSVSTGGFMPRDGTLAVYNTPAVKFTIAITMLIGATSILWHRHVFYWRWPLLRRHRESYWVIAMALGVGLAYGFAFFRLSGGSDVIAPVVALGEGLFTGISLVTTSGFEVRTRSFAVFPVALILLIALAGGGIFSTAGGLKYYRLGAMFMRAYDELHHLLYPHGVRPPAFGSQASERRFMTAIWSFFILSVLAIGILSTIVAATSTSFFSAFTAVIAAFAGIGALYAAAMQESAQWLAFGDMAASAKLALVLTMLLGRLEVLVLFGALARLWRVLG